MKQVFHMLEFFGNPAYSFKGFISVPYYPNMIRTGNQH